MAQTPKQSELCIGWTTVADSATAETLCRGLVEARLVACAQVDSPTRSFYFWNGAVEAADEVRITLKFTTHQLEALEEWLEDVHPYDQPQWVVVRADAVSERYERWVKNSVR